MCTFSVKLGELVANLAAATVLRGISNFQRHNVVIKAQFHCVRAD